MNLIYYYGLNCRLACIVSIANALGVKYTNAFAPLWSENDFTDNAEYHIYTSKKILAGLTAAGINTEARECGAAAAAEYFSRIPDGGLFFIGADFYYIPWHPVYGHFRGKHFFYALKESAERVICYDPVYGESGVRLTPSAALAGAYEIGKVSITNAPPLDYGAALVKEAKAVLRAHPVTQKRLLAGIESCKTAKTRAQDPLIKLITAIINNRYLYARFYHANTPPSGAEEFFTAPHLLKWQAVKNGMIKATIQISKKPAILEEVKSLLISLLCEEKAMASKIIKGIMP